MVERPAPPNREFYESMSAANSAVDPITGFLNRNAGLQAVARAVAEANSRRSLLAVLWVDMDRFRPAEFIRMGSDEFVVLIPGLDRIIAEQLAGKLLLEIEVPMPIDDILFRPSVSIGIALGQVADYPLGLLERADRAMIEAKRQGGNRIVISGDEPVAGRLGVQLAREELAIESALHAALESGGLQLEFQPIIHQDGSVEAVEALMRCNAHGLKIPAGR